MGALLACALLAGCGLVSSGSGPLFDGPDGGTVGEECMSHVPLGSVVSYGFEAFSNRGQTAVTITSVDLARPRGLMILRAWMVPITGTTLYGVGFPGWPPYRNLPKGVRWARRQPADGAVIPPSRGQGQVNLVLALKATRKAATAAGENVYYHEAGQDYHLQTHVAIRVLAAGGC